MEIIYKDNDKNAIEGKKYLIKANYRLGGFDKSIINTYFMDNGFGQYDDYKGQTFQIRSIIGEYLATQQKRTIDETTKIDNNDLTIGKYIAAEIISKIWTNYINEMIKYYMWPRQCHDITKYLIEIDLAEIIGVESIKNILIELYNTLSKRIAILYHQDPNLRISTNPSTYLARANYELLIQGYEPIMATTFGTNKISLDIDLATLTFQENHDITGTYNWNVYPDTITSTTTIGNETIKKLIKSLDNQKKIN